MNYKEERVISSNLVFPKVGYVIAFGALGYRSENPDYYFDMIRKMFEATKKTMAFNMLDKDHFPEHPILIGHNFEEILTYCKTLSSDAKVVKGYLDDDFTVCV